jgi:hypothetical protein
MEQTPAGVVKKGNRLPQELWSNLHMSDEEMEQTPGGKTFNDSCGIVRPHYKKEK